MSRLGKIPITLPKGVEIKLAGNVVTVKGPKGTISCPFKEGIGITIEHDKAHVNLDPKAGLSNAQYGLHRSLINNLVVGVSKGYEKRLTLIGVGYRAAVQGDTLDVQLGFSHPTQIKIPKGIQVTVDKSTLVIITGIDKQIVGQFAANVRAMKKPEPYKGKGIRYEDEFVRKKAGKAAKGKTA